MQVGLNQEAGESGVAVLSCQTLGRVGVPWGDVSLNLPYTQVLNAELF